jgi:hypothetical protein
VDDATQLALARDVTRPMTAREVAGLLDVGIETVSRVIAGSRSSPHR